jgi:hypothetical protein
MGHEGIGNRNHLIDAYALVSQTVMPVRGFPIPSGEVMSTLASQWAIEGTPKEAPRRCH